jgi:hypothetical protein
MLSFVGDSAIAYLAVLSHLNKRTAERTNARYSLS